MNADKIAAAGEAGRAIIAEHLIEGGPGDPDTLELAATLCNAAPAMLAALQGMTREYRQAFGDAIESDGREGGAFAEYFAAVEAITLATGGTPSGETEAPGAIGATEPKAAMGIGVPGYALVPYSDGEGFVLERFEPGNHGPTCRRYISESKLQAALAGLDVDSEAGEG